MSKKQERIKNIMDSVVLPTDRETVGKVASDLMQKKQESLDPIELERAMQSEYMDNLIKCVEDHRKKYIGDFFIVVLTKAEKLMPNVFRNYFYARRTCPTPNFDQSVYMFKADEEEIEYLWTLPDREVAHHLLENALHIHPTERDLLGFIVEFADGTLFKLAKKLSGEQDDSILLAN